MAIYPTSEQIQALLTGLADQPVVMVNLLRFKAQADAPDEGMSGEYPSREKFVEITQSERVREIGIHRAAGLESRWLIATTPSPL